MVLKAEPFLKAIENSIRKIGKNNKYKIIYFSPRGKIFNTEMAKNLAGNFGADEAGLEVWSGSSVKSGFSKKSQSKILNFLKNGFIKKENLEKNIILVSGKYEGIDSRVMGIFPGEEISVGNFVLTGGELPAMILIDSISRQIPGVLGNFNSREEERISAGEFYTRPEILE
jgi:tRNA G37 N-methylase TrmD